MWKQFVETTLAELRRRNTMKLAEVPGNADESSEEQKSQQNDQENKPETKVSSVVIKVMQVKALFKKIDVYYSLQICSVTSPTVPEEQDQGIQADTRIREHKGSPRRERTLQHSRD